jgi:hypothetical protein
MRSRERLPRAAFELSLQQHKVNNFCYFKKAVSSAVYSALSKTRFVKYEVKIIWKEGVLALLEVPTLQLSGGSEDNHKNFSHITGLWAKSWTQNPRT